MFLEWAQERLRTEKNQALDFRKFPFLIPLYNCAADTLVIKKGAQIGATAYVVNFALWLASNWTITVIYTMPTSGDVSDFSQTRFNPVISFSKLGVKTETDNIGVKQLGSSWIFFRGTWTERQAISVPADIIVIDELDFSRPEIVEMYDERMAASPLKMKRILSTPTLPNFGITAEFSKTNKQEWAFTCPACKTEEPVTEENIIDEEYRCRRCKALLDREVGRYVPTGDGKIEGVHISQLCAPWISAKDILDKKHRAKLKKHYYNFVLGMEYAGGEGVLTRVDIVACMMNPVAVEGKACIGVDWGDTSWAIVRRENTILHMEKIEGDTRGHARRVAELMQKFNAVCIADFGYGDTKNKELIEKFPGRVWMCLYNDKVLFPKFDDDGRKVHIDRTIACQESIAEIRNHEVRIFSNDLIETFIDHSTNTVEDREVDARGGVRVVMKNVGDDHLLHAYNYARLLFAERKSQFSYGYASKGEVPIIVPAKGGLTTVSTSDKDFVEKVKQLKRQNSMPNVNDTKTMFGEEVKKK